MSLTDGQHRLVGALDYAVEHLHHEFDRDEYRGASTCGFGWIDIRDGRCSFVRLFRSLAESDDPNVRETRSGTYIAEIGGVRLQLSGTGSGYRLSVSVSDVVDGADHQRMDAQERIHDLILQGLRHDGYLEEAHRRSRVD